MSVDIVREPEETVGAENLCENVEGGAGDTE